MYYAPGAADIGALATIRRGPGVDGSKEPPGPRRGAGATLSDARMDSSPSRRYAPRIDSLDKKLVRKRAPAVSAGALWEGGASAARGQRRLLQDQGYTPLSEALRTSRCAVRSKATVRLG